MAVYAYWSGNHWSYWASAPESILCTNMQNRCYASDFALMHWARINELVIRAHWFFAEATWIFFWETGASQWESFMLPVCFVKTKQQRPRRHRRPSAKMSPNHRELCGHSIVVDIHLCEEPSVYAKQSLHAHKSLGACNYTLCTGRTVSLLGYWTFYTHQLRSVQFTTQQLLVMLHLP